MKFIKMIESNPAVVSNELSHSLVRQVQRVCNRGFARVQDDVTWNVIGYRLVSWIFSQAWIYVDKSDNFSMK